MLTALSGYLKTPYPYYYQWGKALYIGLIVFFMTVGFTYLFEPFVVNRSEHRIPYFWICVVHGSISLIVFWAITLFYTKFGKQLNNWTIKKEIIFIGFILLFIGITDFLARDIIYKNLDNWQLRYLLEEIKNTFLVGMLFCFILILLNNNRLSSSKSLKTNLDIAEKTTVLIKTNLKSDHFSIKPVDFVYAKSEGNYVLIYVLKEEGFSKQLKRISLQQLSLQLQSIPYIFKTHRSYLVNLNQVKSAKGNAQGYTLSLKSTANTIPVSRNNIANFNEKYPVQH